MSEENTNATTSPATATPAPSATPAPAAPVVAPDPATAPAPKTVLERVTEEKSELDAKIDKLTSFITSHLAYQTLKVEDQGLLADQLVHMTNYSDVLGRRIARLSK